MRDLFGKEIPEKMTGKKFEKLIAQILKQQGCQVAEQVNICVKFKNKKHKVDSLVNGNKLVSDKWQNTSGNDTLQLYGDGSLQGKVNISELTDENMETMKQYFLSIGFHI